MFHTSFVNNYNEAQKKKGKERVKKNIMIDPQHHTFSVKLQHANVEKKIEEFIPSVTLIKKKFNFSTISREFILFPQDSEDKKF